VPFIGLLLVFAIDRATYSLFGDITLSPLLCNITLASFAFFLRPRQILFWGSVYTIAAFLLLTTFLDQFDDLKTIGLLRNRTFLINFRDFDTLRYHILLIWFYAI
jgi:hypothetical protein